MSVLFSFFIVSFPDCLSDFHGLFVFNYQNFVPRDSAQASQPAQKRLQGEEKLMLSDANAKV